jgi:hypothetical protein
MAKQVNRKSATATTGNKEHSEFWSADQYGDFAESFKAKHKRLPKAYGPSVAAIIDAANEGDGKTEEEWCELLEQIDAGEVKPAPTASEIIQSAINIATSDNPAATYARNLAAIAAKDVAFDQYMSEMSAVDLKKKRTFMDTFLHLGRIYGAEKLVSVFPKPGFKAPAGSNEHTDLYDVPGKNAKGEPTLIEVSMYDAFADSLPEGVRVLADIENLGLEDTDPKKQAKHKGLTHVSKDALEKTYAQRLSANRERCRNAIKVAYQLQALASIKGLRGGGVMDIDPTTGKETYSANVANPFYVQDNATPTAWMLAGHSKTLSAGSFIAIKFDEVIKQGGNWDAFVKVTKRAKKKPGTPVADFTVQSATQFEAGFASIWSYADKNMKNNSEGMAMLNAKLTKDEHFCISMFEFKDWIVGVCSNAELQKTFARAVATQRAKDNAVAEAMDKGEVKAA